GEEQKDHAPPPAPDKRKKEGGTPTKEQQPADQQRDAESRHCRLDDREGSQHDEKDGGDDEPTGELAGRLEDRTWRSHTTPSRRASVWDAYSGASCAPTRTALWNGPAPRQRASA